MEEANEEAEHKGWCDTELSTNEQTRKEKTTAVETLHAEIDQLEASIAKLTEDISNLTKAVAELDKAVAEATQIRAEEKEKNEATIKDAQEAQTAVAQATEVLKEFYAKAGEATSLIQQQPEAPEIFDEAYTGMQSENGGVVGMLEVIESDFARLEAETTASEAQSQVLLSLIQQLGQNLESNTDLKLKYLEEALTNIDGNHTGTRHHIPAIMSSVHKELTTFSR